MTSLEDLTVEIFADGADLATIDRLKANPLIRGFTTNPTLMRAAGVPDYGEFAHRLLDLVDDRPVGFEVIADEFDEMERQAREIANWGANVFVKIPITNTRGESAVPLVGRLAAAGVQVNATALFTLEQVRAVTDVLAADVAAHVSIFAGRIADTGRDPVPVMAEAVRIMAAKPKARLIWASPREVLNIFHADQAGCHIITVTHDLLAKLPNIGKDLDAFSLETVKMFRDDAVASKYSI